MAMPFIYLYQPFVMLANASIQPASLPQVGARDFNMQRIKK